MPRRVELVDDLRAKLIVNAFRQGEAIPEEAVAAEFSVSRTPIREALIVLECDGLVVSEPNRGFRVASVSIEAIRSYFEAARAIYEPVVLLVKQRAAAAELRRLQSQLEATGSETPERRMLAHYQLMCGLAERSRNPFFVQSVRACEAYHCFVRSSVIKTLPDRAADAATVELAAHDQNILDALLAGPDSDILDVLQQKIEGSRIFLLSNLL